MKPRRSILSVPGHVAKMHGKAAESEADVIMLDLEDSVPPEAKEAARRQVIESLTAIDWHDKTVTVRINSLDTPFAYRDLVDVVEAAGAKIDAVVVPKVNHPGDIHCVDRLLDGIEQACGYSIIGIEASIETAEGLSDVTAIARASKRLRSLVFGIADYSASVGARLVSLSGHGENEAEIYPGHRWHFAVSRMVMAAKANGLLAIDAPYGHFKDSEGLQRSAVMAGALGCDGKWAIHPSQLATINRVFSPTEEDIRRAITILEAAEAAARNRRGAVAVEGRMVDQATVRLARRLYDQARHLGLISQEGAPKQ
ncbi:MAG: citryl-CoA lyase [Desulfobacterales bacterium GWB2_56_26]|nr:MAG: citryl-CoA lyase [Desulfobacterales bacterium GWB2_56_26]